MNITKIIKKMVLSIQDLVPSDDREALYETLLECFDEEDFQDLELNDVWRICPIFDEVLQRCCPDLFEYEPDDEEDGFIDDMDDEKWQEG